MIDYDISLLTEQLNGQLIDEAQINDLRVNRKTQKAPNMISSNVLQLVLNQV